jgi:hypothetical protein
VGVLIGVSVRAGTKRGTLPRHRVPSIANVSAKTR